MAGWLCRTAAALVVVCLGGGASEGARECGTVRRRVGTGNVAAGGAHTLMALPNGHVLAWGAGGRGQIGDGAHLDRWSPVEVPDLANVVAVSAGAAHSVAVTAGGEVYAWGANTFGRLGDGTQRDRSRPVLVNGIAGVRAVAAGRAHTLAVTNSGRVYAWGRNVEGQLGIGSRKSSVVPVSVPGLADVVAIAAGDTHSLAVTADGHVFAWGNNQSSQLGDGTARDRNQPVPIVVADVVAVAAGAAHSLALTRTGAVYSWGRGANGQLGTGSVHVVSTPTLIAGLDASAIAAGRSFSAVIRTDGGVSTWGANDSGQLGDQTTLKRTTPVMLSRVSGIVNLALGSAHAVAVSSSGVVRAWGEGDSGRLGNGSAADVGTPAEVVAQIEDWGPEPPPPPAPPQPPRLTPSGGIFATPQQVSLIPANPEDTIRYTVDGSTPTDTSPVYTMPITIATPATISARSFASGLSSDTTSATYTIDMVPPTIVATATPAIQPGWMTTPVTITFACADDIAVASCSAPVTVASDGAAQEITGVAVDAAGHQVSTTVVISLDLNPPMIAITSPAEPQTTAARVSVTGLITDVSGVASARCNGQPLAVNEQPFQCDVPLQPGRNDIVVSAVDQVGRSSSMALTVSRIGAPSRIALTPAARALEINEAARFSLLDDFGARVDGASWSSSDSAIVQLSDADPPVVTGRAPGRVTVRAEKDGLIAEAEVTVSVSLGAGDVRWSVPPTPDYASGSPVLTNRVDPQVPRLFAVETQAWGRALLRAVGDDGRVLWQQQSPGIPLMGDAFGGVVAGVLADENAGTDFGAYVRLGGGLTRPWRFDSEGALGRPAQAADGTLYAIEYLFGGINIDGDEVWDKYAVVLDGASGALLKRVLLPREVDNFTAKYDGTVLATTPPIQCRSKRYEWAPETVGPVVGTDGRGYYLVRRYHIEKFADCIEPFRRRPARIIDMGLDVYAVSPSGAVEIIGVYSTNCAGALGTTVPCDVPVRLSQLMPDGVGGTLVTWERGTQMVGTAVSLQKSLTRIDADGASAERLVSSNFWIEMVGQQGTAFTYGDNGWEAIDVVSNVTQWTNLLPNQYVLAARPDGGIATLDTEQGQMTVLNASAEVEATQPLSLDWRAVNVEGHWLGLRGGELAAVVGEFDDATRFQSIDKNTGQNRVRLPGVGIWLKTHNAQEPFGRWQHVSMRITPADQDWLSQHRGKFELCAPSTTCLPLGTDVFGNLFFTIGAGPGAEDTNLQCSGVLTKGYDRPNDMQTPPTEPLRQVPVDPALQSLLIASLLKSVDAYGNNLLYQCFPEEHPGFYNSNSFTHGLLHASGVAHDEAPPTRRQAPGWLTPVPASNFGK